MLNNTQNTQNNGSVKLDNNQTMTFALVNYYYESCTFYAYLLLLIILGIVFLLLKHKKILILSYLNAKEYS